MRKLVVNTLTAVLLGLSLSATALADKHQGKDRQKTVTFNEDVLVGDTLVKRGTYRVRFDATAGRVSIQNDREVVAAVRADVQMRSEKSPHHVASFTQTDRGRVLSALRFSGDRREVLLGETASRSAE
jgi:hypothetical protein